MAGQCEPCERAITDRCKTERTAPRAPHTDALPIWAEFARYAVSIRTDQTGQLPRSLNAIDSQFDRRNMAEVRDEVVEASYDKLSRSSCQYGARHRRRSMRIITNQWDMFRDGHPTLRALHSSQHQQERLLEPIDYSGSPFRRKLSPRALPCSQENVR